MNWKSLLAFLLAATLAGCQTVQTTQSGAVGVDRQQAARKGTLNRNQGQVARVRGIASRLVPATAAFRGDAPGWRWEVNVIGSNELNAWCMPGGKVAVYSGLMDRLRLNDDELAAVMGHEIAHALREHGRERASQQAAQNVVLGIGAALLGIGDAGASLARIVADVTVGLPYSREFEREADRIGVELSARAGYDPRAAVSLWQKMAQASGGGTPEFLSTHPAPENRIRDLQSYAARVMPLYESARGGRR